MKEHLVRIHLKNGESIDMHRENGDLKLCHKSHCVIIPRGTGIQALGLYSLLEPLGERIDFPEEGEESDDTRTI